MTRVEMDNARFVAKRLHGIPQIYKTVLKQRYDRFSHHSEANLDLIQTTKAISKNTGLQQYSND